MEHGSGGISVEDLELLAARAGFALAPGEIERLKALYDGYMEMIRVLHEADLAAEEPAAVFDAALDRER